MLLQSCVFNHVTFFILSSLYQTCENNLVTSLKIPSSLFQVVNNLFHQTRNKQCEHNNVWTTCLQTCNNLCVFTCVGQEFCLVTYQLAVMCPMHHLQFISILKIFTHKSINNTKLLINKYNGKNRASLLQTKLQLHYISSSNLLQSKLVEPRHKLHGSLLI